ERRDGLEVLKRRNLAGGVARDRNRQILRGDTGPVVSHSDKAGAAALNIYFDTACACIEAVLDEFLDYRRRALHHLAGGDLVAKLARQDPNGHSREFTAKQPLSRGGGRLGEGDGAVTLLREACARGRVLREVHLHALEDRVRQLVLLAGTSQAQLFSGVRYIG